MRCVINAKTHFSIRRKNTSGINVPIMPKIGKGPKKILQSELFLTQKVYILLHDDIYSNSRCFCLLLSLFYFKAMSQTMVDFFKGIKLL